MNLFLWGVLPYIHFFHPPYWRVDLALSHRSVRVDFAFISAQ